MEYNEGKMMGYAKDARYKEIEIVMDMTKNYLSKRVDRKD